MTRVDLDHNYWKITLIGFVLNWLPKYFWIHWLFHNDFPHTTRNPEKRDLEVTCCLINQCGSEISFSLHRQIEDCRDNDIWYIVGGTLIPQTWYHWKQPTSLSLVSVQSVFSHVYSYLFYKLSIWHWNSTHGLRVNLLINWDGQLAFNPVLANVNLVIVVHIFLNHLIKS